LIVEALSRQLGGAMESPEIVPITEDHIDRFHRALDFVARERRYLAFLEAPPIENTRAFVRDMIKRGYPQYVAVAAGDVVGWCDVTPKDRPIHAHTGVLGISLLPQFRGRGIGTKLMTSVLAAARGKGLHRVELTVREANASAIALYKKMGFEFEGLFRDAVQIDGVYENVICMAVLF
jgi:RimJ/RimL family protein N-acetyltransferase